MALTSPQVRGLLNLSTAAIRTHFLSDPTHVVDALAALPPETRALLAIDSLMRDGIGSPAYQAAITAAAAAV